MKKCGSVKEIKIGWNSIYHKIDGFFYFTPLMLICENCLLIIDGS
jgi:hypothetical protein